MRSEKGPWRGSFVDQSGSVRRPLMAEDHRLPPSAACLSASMRDLGYSLETAVADLVDNSISAEATKVEIVCEIAAASPYLAVIDNGRGMSRPELIDAMKHGSSSPKTKRGSHDLGRSEGRRVGKECDSTCKFGWG